MFFGVELCLAQSNLSKALMYTVLPLSLPRVKALSPNTAPGNIVCLNATLPAKAGFASHYPFAALMARLIFSRRLPIQFANMAPARAGKRRAMRSMR